MTAKKISQLDEITTLTGNEEVPVAHEGQNFKFKIHAIKSIVTKSDVGLSNVDNTSDLQKPVSNAVQSALNGKANNGHGHSITDVANLSTTLAQKADLHHDHAITEVTGLQGELDNRALLSHEHMLSELPEVQQALSQKAALSHNHNATDITGLQTLLNSKADVNHTHQATDIVGLQTEIETIIANSNLGLGDVSVDKLEW